MHGRVSTSQGTGGMTGPAVAAVGLAALCAVVFALLIALRPTAVADAETAAALDRILLWSSLLPRAAVALIAGAALGLAGALLQRVLRNPIADPSTLGIAAGAQLALTAALTVAPALLALSREGVAFAGGLAAAGLVLAMSWRRGLDPVTVALSGMMVTLMASALSVAIILARGEYAMSIFIWGAGALSQQSWDAVLAMLPRVGLGLAATLLLIRTLTLLGLDDRSARSLGLSLAATRFAGLALAVALTATVTAEVGIIGFVGLAAPALARYAGVRTMPGMLLAAPLTGAALLFVTDATMQLLGPGFSDLAPAGAATALLGGPVLLALLPRLHAALTLRPRPAPTAERSLSRPGRVLAGVTVFVLLLVVFTLTVGRDETGWHVATGALFSDLLPFRAPRTAVAFAAGAMLGAAGFLMQRLTGNPLASPEVLGVSAGGGAGLTLVLLFFAMPGPVEMFAGMIGGSLATFLVMLAIAARSRFGPERLLLSGVAIGAFSMAILTAVLASGGMRGFILLTWMSGSTNRAGSFEAWTAVVAAVVLIGPLPFMARWLTILPLGGGTSRALGLPLAGSRLALALFAALLTAIASFTVGPLSLAGLVAPHAARLIGFTHVRHQLFASALSGGCLILVADWFARIVIFPYQVPTGLFASLIGGPCLIWLLNRRKA
jgi:ABC-type Fe3+-siderophore transport system permease subunit